MTKLASTIGFKVIRMYNLKDTRTHTGWKDNNNFCQQARLVFEFFKIQWRKIQWKIRLLSTTSQKTLDLKTNQVDFKLKN